MTWPYTQAVELVSVGARTQPQGCTGDSPRDFQAHGCLCTWGGASAPGRVSAAEVEDLGSESGGSPHGCCLCSALESVVADFAAQLPPPLPLPWSPFLTPSHQPVLWGIFSSFLLPISTLTFQGGAGLCHSNRGSGASPLSCGCEAPLPCSFH